MIKECADDSWSRGTSYSEHVERHVPERRCDDGVSRQSRGMLNPTSKPIANVVIHRHKGQAVEVGSNSGQRTVLFDETSHGCGFPLPLRLCSCRLKIVKKENGRKESCRASWRRRGGPQNGCFSIAKPDFGNP
jgi:hypothetical protein